jgi:acetolactate synthase-1/2/3 large subunit
VVGFLGFTINPTLRARFKECDCLLVVGDRLGEQTTQGYTLIEAPVPKQPLIHVYPGPEELGRVFKPVLPIHAGVAAFAAAARQLKPIASPAWAAWRAAAREDFKRYQAPLNRNGEIDLSCIVAHVREVLPDDAIVTNGAGNYAGWVARFFEFRDRGSQLAPQGGSMGYGFPAGIAAKLRHPERTVVTFAGDGCFLMAATEFATAMQRKLPVVVIVVNNGMYGAIRAHQERHYPGRPVGTELHNPDFADFARSFGGFGVVVSKTTDFPAAFAEALAAKMPAIVELRVDPEELSPGVTVAALRAAAKAPA